MSPLNGLLSTFTRLLPEDVPEIDEDPMSLEGQEGGQSDMKLTFLYILTFFNVAGIAYNLSFIHSILARHILVDFDYWDKIIPSRSPLMPHRSAVLPLSHSPTIVPPIIHPLNPNRGPDRAL